jgi:hypothetical protein
MKLKTTLQMLAIAFCLFFSVASFAQADSTALKPEESTFYDGPVNTVFTPGLLIKTRSGNFYEITDKIKQKNKINNPTVQAFKEGKKYKLLIQGIDKPLTAVKAVGVIESNIDGDFKGWEGTTTFKLVNGQSWQQDEYGTLFANLYRPVVYIYRAADGTYKMKIAGVEQVLIVRQK